MDRDATKGTRWNYRSPSEKVGDRACRGLYFQGLPRFRMLPAAHAAAVGRDRRGGLYLKCRRPDRSPAGPLPEDCAARHQSPPSPSSPSITGFGFPLRSPSVLSFL